MWEMLIPLILINIDEILLINWLLNIDDYLYVITIFNIFNMIIIWIIYVNYMTLLIIIESKVLVLKLSDSSYYEQTMLYLIIYFSNRII